MFSVEFHLCYIPQDDAYRHMQKIVLILVYIKSKYQHQIWKWTLLQLIKNIK